MQYPRNGERELGNRGIELRAVLGHHLIRAAHGADHGGDRAAAGVLEMLTRLDQGLLSDHAPVELTVR